MRNIPNELDAAVSSGDLIGWLRAFADQGEGLHNAARKADPVHYTSSLLLTQAAMLRAAADSLAYLKEHTSADKMVRRVVDGLKEEGDPAQDPEVQARVLRAAGCSLPNGMEGQSHLWHLIQGIERRTFTLQVEEERA